jgi:hypothetical protein
MTRNGTYIILVAELLGHSAETTRRCDALPTQHDRQAAIERLHPTRPTRTRWSAISGRKRLESFH